MKCIYDIILSFFSKSKCSLCNKYKRKTIKIPVYCDIITLEDICNKTIDYMNCCKNCVYELYKKDMIFISYKMFIKNTILDNITIEDLSNGSKIKLSKLQDVIIKENNRNRSLNVFSHSITIKSPVEQYLS